MVYILLFFPATALQSSAQLVHKLCTGMYTNYTYTAVNSIIIILPTAGVPTKEDEDIFTVCWCVDRRRYIETKELTGTYLT